MPLSSEMMGAGFSAGQARGINGRVNSTFSCAGSTVADAQAIVTTTTVITTCASGAGGILPAVPPGDSVWIYNATTTPATIYPDTGASINQLSANVGMLLAPYTDVWLRRTSTTQWLGHLSA